MSSTYGGFFMEEERAGTPNKFIVLRQEVLYEPTLTMADKLVYTRMCQFDEYFESCEEASALLGISPITIKRAKQKLIKLGYAKEIDNTGRGKRYKVCYDIDKRFDVRQTDKKCPSEGQKMSVRRTKNVRIVKEIEKKENNCLDKSKQLAEAEHGNHDINEMFEAWENQFGFEQKQSTANRRACYNLLRKKDVGRARLITLMRLVDEASKDRFAPREVRGIVGFASLQTNLPHLMMWARRKYSQRQEQGGLEI